jgi:HAMP domain-containing protein
MLKNLPIRVKLLLNLTAILVLFLAFSLAFWLIHDLNEYWHQPPHFLSYAIFFAALLLFLSVILVVWNFTGRLIDRLLALRAAVAEVERRGTVEPLPILADDEIGRLKAAFNHMSEKLAQSRAAMIENTKKLELEVAERSELFENSPISLWEEDYSGVMECLKASGVADPREYFQSHREEIAKCAGLVKVLNVNRAALDLFKAGTKADFDDWQKLFTRESYEVFKAALIALFEGKTRFESEAVGQTLAGEKKNIVVKLVVLPRRAPNDLRALISVTDITGIKAAETGLKQKMKELKEFSDAAIGRELKLEAMEKELAGLKRKLEQTGRS